jgi:hypothetical protein
LCRCRYAQVQTSTQPMSIPGCLPSHLLSMRGCCCLAVDDSAQAKLQELATNLLTECPTATAAVAETAATASHAASTQRQARKRPAVSAAAGATGATGALVPSDGFTSAAMSTNGTAAAGLQGPSDAATASGCSGLYLWPTFDLAPTNAGTAAAVTEAGTAAAQQRPSQGAAEQQLPLHLSISRTVPIKRIQIESLQAALTKQLKPFKAFRAQLQGLVCLANDTATRSFVGIKVATGEKQVNAHPCSTLAFSLCPSCQAEPVTASVQDEGKRHNFVVACKLGCLKCCCLPS